MCFKPMTRFDSISVSRQQRIPLTKKVNLSFHFPTVSVIMRLLEKVNLRGERMENVISMNANKQMTGANAQAASARGHQVPLSFLQAGEQAAIVKIRGKEDLQRHLGTMGFVAGASIKVVSQVAGNMIVEVKGTQVALSQQVATHVITSASS